MYVCNAKSFAFEPRDCLCIPSLIGAVSCYSMLIIHIFILAEEVTSAMLQKWTLTKIDLATKTSRED